MIKISNLDLNSENVESFLDEFITNFISKLEIEIIPNIFEQISLPSLPTRAEIKKYDLKRSRIPKVGREIYEEKHPYKKALFIREIANLKKQFNGHKINKSSILEGTPYLDYNAESFDIISSRRMVPSDLKELFFQQIDFTKLLHKETESRSFIEKIKEKSLIKRGKIIDRVLIEFDDGIERRIKSDEIFMKFINQLEISLNRYINLSNIYMDGYLFFEKDFEIPDLDKVILSLNLDKLSIQEKLDIWDQIDNFLRSEIEKLAEILTDNEKDKIFKFNQAFFTEIKLN